MAWNHQTINHVKHNIFQTFGMEQGRWSDPSQWLDRFIFDLFLLPQVAALWNQAVEFSAAWPAGEVTPLAD